MVLNSLKTWFKNRHLGRNALDTRYALLEACLIGFLSAIAALLLKQGVGWLGGWRLQLSHQYPPWLVLPLVGFSLGSLAGGLLQFLSPASAGGGIPQVKAALARFIVPLSLKVAVVKMIGTILVLGAGLTLGRRAPTVHIGAALAAQLSDWLPTSPEHRRQMIAAGAAAGLAAGFLTPIAGVLFVVEELMRDISGLTLETAIVASFTGAVVSRFLTPSAGEQMTQEVFKRFDTNFITADIPFYIVLGILAGILGALFNQGILRSFQVYRRLNLALQWRIGLTGLLSGVIIAFMPPFFRDNAGLQDILVQGDLSPQAIALAFTAHFALTILAYGCSAPGGLFAPALVMGSALGYLVGDLEGFLTGNQTASTFALAGMGAFFTATVRVPVTAIVIVFELNADFEIVLPLMITCAIAYIVAESFSKGSLYEHLLKNSGIQLSEDNPYHDFLATLTAADVMQSQVETLESEITVDSAIKIMSISHHRGFPVLKKGKLVGIFTQGDLRKLSLHASHETLLLKDVMVTRPITVKPSDSLSDVLYLLNHYELSRLPVTEDQKLVGIITRTDIIRVEAHQLEGKGNPQKADPSYIVYQTRSPAQGRGRILLPLVNPSNASALLKMAMAIAQAENYEIDCLQVIVIPSHSPTAQTGVDTRKARKLMQKMERAGRHNKISLHTEIRVGHNVATTILETLQQRHSTLLLMGWKGQTTTQDAIFGDVVDTLIRKAPCELMLVKLGEKEGSFPNAQVNEESWLIPMAGGPNVERAIALVPALSRLSPTPDTLKLWLCKVFAPQESELETENLYQTAENLRKQLSATVIPLPIRAQSVSDALIRFAESEDCNLIILGVSREGLLSQVIQGNIPNAIAQNFQGTVILFRGIIS